MFSNISGSDGVLVFLFERASRLSVLLWRCEFGSVVGPASVCCIRGGLFSPKKSGGLCRVALPLLENAISQHNVLELTN
jgi:hypothetical protein